MDLRYLEFLLTSYSWAVIVFFAIMVLWLALNNISEISLGTVKLKPAIAFRSLGSLLILLVLFSCAIQYTIDEIKSEIEVQKEAMYESKLDKIQIKTAWLNFFEKITHQSNTAAFAFIKTERNPDYNWVVTEKETSVQFVLKWSIMILPIFYLMFELGLLGFLYPFGYTAFGWAIVLMMTLTWVPGVLRSVSQIKDVVATLVNLAN